MEEKSNPLKIFLYISAWVIIWGTFGSLIDYPLYKNKIYLEGSIFQYLTFTIIAILGFFTWLKELNKKKLTVKEL